MAEQTLSEQLSRHIATLSIERIPTEVVDAAKLHILDSLGCVLAGSRLEPGRLAYNLAVAVKPGNASSTLFGTNLRASYLDAVQAMATAAHCGELDDIHGGAATCIGGMVVPALLAMAEKHGGSGRQFLEAAVAGYETTARIGLEHRRAETVCSRLVAEHGLRCLRRGGGWGEVFRLARRKDDQRARYRLSAHRRHAHRRQEGATARHLAFGSAARNGMLALLATRTGTERAEARVGRSARFLSDTLR